MRVFRPQRRGDTEASYVRQGRKLRELVIRSVGAVRYHDHDAVALAQELEQAARMVRETEIRAEAADKAPRRGRHRG